MLKTGRGIHKKKCSSVKTKKFIPQPHQLKVLDYMLTTKNRGLLLYHRLGSGKTCSAILVADNLLKSKKINQVYVLSSGSLRENFIKEYCSVCGKKPKKLEETYTFITYNTNVGNYLPKNFNDSLVIIDEVHNLINSIKNSSKNAVAIYRTLIASKNIKLLFLTGTPIYNNPYEIAILFNILKPNSMPNILIENGNDFEIDSDKFDSLFDIKDDGTYKIKKIKTIENIKGLVSYVPGFSEEFYPRVIEEEIQKVPMSAFQENIYLIEREKEAKFEHPPESHLKYTNPRLYGLLQSFYILAKKNILSKRASNFAYPEYIMTYYREEISSLDSEGFSSEDFKTFKDSLPDKTTKNGGWISHKSLKNNLRIYSPKIKKLLNNIAQNFDGKHMIFSFFKERSGVNLLSAILTTCGVKNVIYSGDISSDKERSIILEKFNSPSNNYGDNIKVILVTDAGAEGITLKAVRFIHILEGDKRENKIQQVIGRVVRYKSHEDLPVSKREVHIFRYWSVFKDTSPLKIMKEVYDKKTGEKKMVQKVIKRDIGIDEKLYDTGNKRLKSVNSVLKLLQEISIENE